MKDKPEGKKRHVVSHKFSINQKQTLAENKMIAVHYNNNSVIDAL